MENLESEKPEIKKQDKTPEEKTPSPEEKSSKIPKEKEIDPEMENYKKPPLPPIFDYDFDKVENKPWKNQNEDITDYFNYGYNEEIWKLYVKKCKKLYSQTKIKKSEIKSSLWLDTKIPVEIGGFGKPINEELEEFEAINILLNSPEMFLHYFNLSENPFYYYKLYDFLEKHIDNNNNYYYSILLQYYEREGIDVVEGYNPKQKNVRKSNYHDFSKNDGFLSKGRNIDFKEFIEKRRKDRFSKILYESSEFPSFLKKGRKFKYD